MTKILIGLGAAFFLCIVAFSVAGAIRPWLKSETPLIDKPTVTAGSAQASVQDVKPESPPTIAAMSMSEQRDWNEYEAKLSPALTDLKRAIDPLSEFTDLLDRTDAVSRAKAKALAGSIYSDAAEASMSLALISAPNTAKPFHSCMKQGVDLLSQGMMTMQFALIMDDATDISESLDIIRAAGTQMQKCQTLLP